MFLRSPYGVPFGKAGRSLVMMIATQALLQGHRDVSLGHVSEAFRKMNLAIHGGRKGSVERVKEQFKRFYGTVLSLEMKVSRPGFEGFRGKQMVLAEEMELYWTAKEKDIMAPGLFENRVKLSEPYFRYINEHCTPVDILVYNAFEAPRDQDFYAWLALKVYAAHESGKPSLVPWESMYLQFGPILRNNQARFRKDFEDFMLRVLRHHPDLKVELLVEGVKIKPSPLVIARDRIGYAQL